MFDTVLVANRGEIAVRVIRTLRRLGVRSVAVYSDADAGARHVREADTAVRIGPAAASESYLSVERLLEAAERTGAQAVHPGYGFLAENAAFARAVTESGRAFIGPPASAIELMGDKIRAKETVLKAGVPVVPGSSGSGLSDAQLIDAATEVGVPVLLKPSAGGGGKGMRLVRDPALFAEEIAAARREARGSFGDDTLLVERWVDRPRHIEIQVMADGHGNVVHFGERECSLQRRHQKIIEEAPSPFLDEETRSAMGAAAVEAARSCGYRGAGTVEFIVAGTDARSYFFMEMNTRLQVEHPVTELVCGVDLVEWQLRVAAGEQLPWRQGDIRMTGHAVEARICAETARPSGERVDFLPSAGTVRLLREPGGEGVRVDSGLSEGSEVGTTYDPMLAKVIAYGTDRSSALRRLRAALAETTVLGVDTNTGFLRALLAHPAVRSGELDTGLVDRDAASLVAAGVPDEVYATAALLRHAALEPSGQGWTDPFSVPSGWRLDGRSAWTTYHFRAPGAEPVAVAVRGRGPGTEVRIGAEGEPVAAHLAAEESGRVRTEWRGTMLGHHHVAGAGERWLGSEGSGWHLVDHDPVAAALRGGAGAHGADALTAPMPGTVTVVKASVGDRVEAGQALVIVEAMKMEHVISAPHAGTVTELDVRPGSTVAMDQVLAVVDPDAADPDAANPGADTGPDADTGPASDTDSDAVGSGRAAAAGSGARAGEGA
ncbi:acetyl/propionyl-CoA carboxylase subunit alpha [Streptomyces sp. P38-E01]|uniref:Biotin-dependent 3-methylcrotonyl-coenzyme A carboxylase alpha1 subunit n=1 Tax=Streptomyces tardus TaxID=2780544 RepID=A0A949JM93_9ACTN|nr:biotin carboxylase N-terminal domain-containing protein [Streptomyces tardus]MBU7598779.1 acetyl/propionyl-CoA carboxylase subunit alpha [Streptomyces tardus]